MKPKGRDVPNQAWHFILADHRTGEGTILVSPGQTLTVNPPLELYRNGLHFSRRAIDALEYAPGPVICRVQIGGDILESDDEDLACCSERTCLWMADATDTLRLFARQCALDGVHVWDLPMIVRHYLESGDESIRGAAQIAAKDAAWAATSDDAWHAAWAAAWIAAKTRALAAARAAARDGARDAAWDAAWAAAWARARDAQNERLEAMMFALVEA